VQAPEGAVTSKVQAPRGALTSYIHYYRVFLIRNHMTNRTCNIKRIKSILKAAI